jgi:redox-sensing transcriptional repressor
MEDVIRDAGIQIAMIATPSQTAQAVAEQLVTAGVKAILNYAPINLTVPDEIISRDSFFTRYSNSRINNL